MTDDEAANDAPLRGQISVTGAMLPTELAEILAWLKSRGWKQFGPSFEHEDQGLVHIRIDLSHHPRPEDDSG